MRLNSDKKRKMTVVKSQLGIIPLALLAACGQQDVAKENVRPVKAFVVQAPVQDKQLVFSGVIAPRIESSLGFRVSGKIVERFVNVGDRVKSGQKVARLDEIDLKLSENSARVQVNAARTRLAVAKDALNRAKTLLANKFVAQATVDQRQLEVDSAQSALDAAQDQFNQAVNATSYAVLTANKDGMVTSVRAEPGQVVSVGQAVITLAQAGDIEATVAIPEQDIASLKPGQTAQVSLWAAPEIQTKGVIREIAGAAEPASRTYAVRVSIPSPTPEMRLGMTSTVSFRVATANSVMTIPLSALAEQNGKTITYIVSRDTQTVTAREVEIAGVTEAGASVSKGLNPGEIIVTGGVQFMKDGTKVRLPKELLPNVAEIKQ